MKPTEPFLVVTIDTECDKSANWRTAAPLRYTGVTEAIPNRLQPLFAEFDIRPSYLISPEVIAHPESCAVLRSIENVELTTHLHGDYMVPQIETWDFAETLTDEMQWEYPPELERAKLAALTELFIQQFGRCPKSFRAGRFGISAHTGRWLRELGYQVDSSVTPHVCWTSRHGEKRPDFRGFSEQPYTIGQDGNIWTPGDSDFLEVPVTLLPAGTVPANNAGEPIWFRPWYSDAETLCRIVRHLTSQAPQNGLHRPLVMMFHNVELVAGASPYAQSEADVRRYLEMLKRVFDQVRRLGIKSCTLAEYYQHFMAGRGTVTGPMPQDGAPAETTVKLSPTFTPEVNISPDLIPPMKSNSAETPAFLPGKSCSSAKPKILLIADVPNWIFARHCQTLERLLSAQFRFTTQFRGEAYREADYDLIYPLEWNLVPKGQIGTPAKYVTGIRSHLIWKDENFLPFVDFLATGFQRVHAVSKRLHSMFRPFLPSVDYVTHGVDTAFFTPQTRADGCGRTAVRLGWAGNRRSPTKGFEQYIAPLARLPGVELCFCGYHDKNLNLQQMRDFYESIDVYVCSSLYEGNNNSLMEAAAMQRAIITCDNGTVPEYLRDGDSAIVIEREVPNFIRAALELRDDPTKRLAMGARARSAVQNAFEWQEMAKCYAAFFNQALANSDAWRPAPNRISRQVIQLDPGNEVAAENLALLSRSPGLQPPGKAAPVVSVVVACYRQAHFLCEAVASVVAQTFNDWEIVIVNDGSPDNTSEVARGLAAKYPNQRISLLEQCNGGLSAARNAGIRAARGRYILPLDADDMLCPTMLEKLVLILEARPEVGFAYTHIQHFGTINTVWPLPDFDRATIISKDNIACGCALFRKSAWEQVGGYNETMREGYEDWDFWVGFMEHGWDGFCLHEPLFLYRKHAQSMLSGANQKRKRLVARIVQNHPRLYDASTRAWAEGILRQFPDATSPVAPLLPSPAIANAPLRLTYLITSILGVTGGNLTLLRQAEEMRRRGHQVTIVTYTPRPDWFQFGVRVVQVPAGQALAPSAPPSDVAIATYFINALELKAVKAPVKVYYAQGDQFIFTDASMADTPQNRQFRALSRASYLLPGIRFVPNSRNLANAVEKLCGRQPDAILPVCTDQTIFRPLQRSLPGSKFRLLIVGPDSRGTETEPLLFKGIQDIRDALQILAKRYPHFTAVRMSGTSPDIFAKFPCEFYVAPDDGTKTALFGTAHILIYASHYDSCPRPPQEAMAAGCAVVCTATTGAREYCRDGENSLLVPVQSPVAIADAVERLIHDHALREKLVQGGLVTAREFPREREWNEWEAMLLRFVQEAARKNGHAIKEMSAPSPPSISTPPSKSQPISLPPCALVGHPGQARALFGQKKLRAAWESTLAAIKSRPFHPEAYLLLAQIAQTAGDAASSRRCAQHARSLAPEWKPVKRFLKSNLRGNSSPEWLVLPESIAPRSSPPAVRLSICLIVKDEERFLGQCLASARGLAAQIVIVDTGSTDRTVAIAKEHGAEVHDFAWCDDFSAARNAALEHATGDWVLMLDADEELPPASHDALRRLLAVPSVMAWRLPIIDVGRENEGCSYVPRLFRNAPALFYVGRVHEQVFSSIEVRRQEWGLDSRLGDAALRHGGYLPEVVKDRNKIQRNLLLLEKAIVELPDEPNLLMNYGLELVRSGQAETGLVQYRKAFDLMSAQAPSLLVPETREMLLTQFCTQLTAQRHFDEIIRILTSPLAQIGGLTASLHFALGLAHLELKQPRAAADQMRQCLAKRGQPSLAPINPEIHKAGPHHCLGLCLAQFGELDAAAEELCLAIKDAPESRPARFDYARLLAARDQPVEALNLLFELVKQKPDDSAVWFLGGQIALSRPEFLEVALDWTAEARQNLPQDLAVLRHRAEALTLAAKWEEALPVWQQLPNESDPSVAAALVLCETLANEVQFAPPPHLESEISRAFVKWYQRLIQFGARSVIERVNARLGALACALPSAASVLSAALADALETAPV